MSRVLALLGAAALVAAALIVRGIIDGDDDGGDGSGGEGRLVVVCATDLRDACEALEGVDVRSADAVDTATALSGGEATDVDAWITTSAWVEVVGSRAEEALGDATAIASSEVAVGAVPDRAGALAALCEGHAVWRCLGDSAGRPWSELGGQDSWGPLRTGLPAADSAVGLSVTASVAGGFFGHLDFAANDFSELRPWLAGLSDASGRGERDPLGTMVTRIGSYSASGTTAAQIGAITRPVELFDAAPVVTATVVAAPVADGDGLPDLVPLRDAFVDRGWAPFDGRPAPTLKPGVMAALHTLWTEITR